MGGVGEPDEQVLWSVRANREQSSFATGRRSAVAEPAAVGLRTERHLVDALEDRWTEVTEDTRQREMSIVGGLDRAEVAREYVRFPSSDAEELARWLTEHGPQLPSRVFSGVRDVTAGRGGLTVRFRSGPEPAAQEVAGRRVACHLHGVVPRAGGDHVADPAQSELADHPLPAPNRRRGGA